MTEQEKRDRVLWFAHKEVGVKEADPKKPNKIKYNDWFYGREVYDGIDLKGNANKTCKYPWCGTSQSWVFHHAGFPLGVIDYTKGMAGCPYAVKNISKWGREVSIEEAMPGDIIFFDFDGNGSWDHVGLADDMGDRKTWVKAIEGNTSSDEKGSQSNGGEFCSKTRNPQKIKMKFARPNCYDREIVKV